LDLGGPGTTLAERRSHDLKIAEKQIDLYGSGIRGVVVGAGFVITAAITYMISERMAVLSIFMLAFASYFLGTGVSRLLQSNALKALLSPPDPDLQMPPRELRGNGRQLGSSFETDDLDWVPTSITENTTTLLDPENKK
jgi:hypothetical protein